MSLEKDIRFTEKKVDAGWKDTVARDAAAQNVESKAQTREGNREANKNKEAKPSQPLVTLLSSLGMQALIQLGEVEDPGTGLRSQDLAGAKATIEFLRALKEKTQGNLTGEESKLLESIIYNVQVKFVEQTKPSRV